MLDNGERIRQQNTDGTTDPLSTAQRQTASTREAADRITSVDIAEETAALIAAQVRQNVITGLLAQANLQAPLLLKLLK